MRSVILKTATRLMVGLIMILRFICCCAATMNRAAALRRPWWPAPGSPCFAIAEGRTKCGRHSPAADPSP
jgi:hypothetical protein